MSLEGERVVQSIRVHLVRNKKTGLLVALSDDLKGLMVAARTEQQIERELPNAIREVLEAGGKKVAYVTAGPDTEGLPSGFVSSVIIANAHLAPQ